MDRQRLSLALQRRFWTMNKKNNSIEDELNAIRIDLYEQTKRMTPNERIDYLRKLAAPIHKEFGITPISNEAFTSQNHLSLTPWSYSYPPQTKPCVNHVYIYSAFLRLISCLHS
jgi:hypothetical protein